MGSTAVTTHTSEPCGLGEYQPAVDGDRVECAEFPTQHVLQRPVGEVQFEAVAGVDLAGLSTAGEPQCLLHPGMNDGQLGPVHRRRFSRQRGCADTPQTVLQHPDLTVVGEGDVARHVGDRVLRHRARNPPSWGILDNADLLGTVVEVLVQLRRGRLLGAHPEYVDQSTGTCGRGGHRTRVVGVLPTFGFRRRWVHVSKVQHQGTMS